MSARKAYPIEQIDPVAIKIARRYKYGQIVKLEIGEGFRVPLADLSYSCADPAGVLRTVAWAYGRDLSRKFRTRTMPDRSVMIYRVA